jgi:hypothetical protein
MTRAALLFALSLACAGCGAATRAMLAEPGDLADYRAFRAAAHAGMRLRRAQEYLRAHPDGAFTVEVRSAFEREEPEYFERAKTSRARASEYLQSLPDGPHAQAAVALLTTFDVSMEDILTEELLRDARRTEATLEKAAARRRAVGEAILARLGALLDKNVYGARLEDAPAPLKRVLQGDARSTWGTIPWQREDDFYFTLPTRPERQSRFASVSFSVALEADVVTEGSIEGPDLFVHWTEAAQMRALDPTVAEDREIAAAHVHDVVGGALEATMPPDRCARKPEPGELVARACDGWRATVAMGARAGDVDTILIRGPKR